MVILGVGGLSTFLWGQFVPGQQSHVYCTKYWTFCMRFLEKFMHLFTSVLGKYFLLSHRGWGLFSTKGLILENIFHNSLSQKFTILPPSTDQVPTKYRPSSSQKFTIYATDVVFNIYFIYTHSGTWYNTGRYNIPYRV